MPYHSYINVHKPILIDDSRKITELGDMLNTPKLLHDYAWEIPRAPSDAYQGNTKQTDTICLSLPSNNTLLDLLGPVSGAQAAQISQLTISVPRKRKDERYSSSDSIFTHKAHRLILSEDTQMATEP